jgi:hypothetical protein
MEKKLKSQPGIFNKTFAKIHYWNQREQVGPLVVKMMRLYYDPTPPKPDETDERPAKVPRKSPKRKGRRRGRWHALPVVFGQARLEEMHAKGQLRYVTTAPKVRMKVCNCT